jgi:membrane fusion protein, multidrug efflux system
MLNTAQSQPGRPPCLAPGRGRERRGAARGSLVAALAAAVGLAGCNGDSKAGATGGPPPVGVEVVEVRPGALPRTLQAVGTLQSPEGTTIAAELSAQVIAVDLPEGQSIEAGRLLARLDDAQARAELKRARARMEQSRARKQRLEALRASSISSEQATDDATAEYRMASAELEEAQTTLAKTKVQAPFAGKLGLQQVRPGQYVKPGDPIVDLTPIGLELLFAVPQQNARDLAVGQKVLGRIGTCGDRFEGTVSAIEPRVDRSSRTVRVKALVDDPGGRFWPGMAASVRVQVGEIPAALRVPQEAVIRQGSQYLVYAVDAEGKAEPRTVELGEFFVDSVHVRSGITPGDRVVVSGHQKLRPGTATETAPYRPLANPNLELGWAGPGLECEGE